MKVFNLRCAHEHGFEGWFGSEDDYQQQLDRGLIECPLCGDRLIQRLPSAPRLNLSGAREPQPPVPAKPPAAGGHAPSTPPQPIVAHEGQGPGPHPTAAMVQAVWMQAVQHVLKNTEDVGERFPDEARRIHYGETEHRAIRGQATPEQRAELADEGIEVVALPLPAGLKGPLQ